MSMVYVWRGMVNNVAAQRLMFGWLTAAPSGIYVTYQQFLALVAAIRGVMPSLVDVGDRWKVSEVPFDQEKWGNMPLALWARWGLAVFGAEPTADEDSDARDRAINLGQILSNGATYQSPARAIYDALINEGGTPQVTAAAALITGSLSALTNYIQERMPTTSVDVYSLAALATILNQQVEEGEFDAIRGLILGDADMSGPSVTVSESADDVSSCLSELSTIETQLSIPTDTSLTLEARLAAIRLATV